ncbi:zinc finger, mynd-type domain containing protein, partial [Colletotrichum musicola]
TITKPTVVAADRGGDEFAITFEDRGIDLRPVKTGWTIIVPRAVRTRPREGKKGFVRVAEGRGTGVKYVPAGLEVMFELGRMVRGEEEEEEGEGGGEEKKVVVGAEGRCAGCGKEEGECQTSDWKLHKVDCKPLKGMANAWGARGLAATPRATGNASA